MATRTTNYNLIKPAATDKVDIGNFNSNSDTIDSTMKSISNVANSASTTANAANTTAGEAKTKAESALTGLNGKADTVHTHSQYLQASDITGKANKPTKTLTTMYSASWSASKVYDFTADYPTATYDLEIEIASNATEEQIDAYTAAKVVASSDLTNKAVAMGDIPTIDIPILLTVTGK